MYNHRIIRSKNSVVSSISSLSDAEIEQAAPSIFSEGQHQSRSDRYEFISTIDVLNGLKKEGFLPYSVSQTRARSENQNYTKHMVRLRPIDQKIDDVANEIILVNSHNGTSSYRMFSGCFRFICLNGMISGDMNTDIRIRHTGNAIHNVIEGAYTIIKDFDRMNETREAMKNIRLSNDAQLQFAKAALCSRYGLDSDNNIQSPINEYGILRVNRREDRENTLWNTFNTVQENMIKGGVRYTTENHRRVSTKPVRNIDNNIKLNQALWILGETEINKHKA